MSQPGIDLTSELSHGVCLSGVNYRRIETACPLGVGFSAVTGKARFHFVSYGLVLLYIASGEQFTFESDNVLFIPNGNGHALLSDPQITVISVAQLLSETVCSTVSYINTGGRLGCPEHTVIFSGCMDFELGGIQSLVRATPEVVRVNSLLNTQPEIQPLLVVMERESLTRQVGYVGVFARLADVVAMLIVRGWVGCGCDNTTGQVQVLCDPRLTKAIYAVYQRPGVNWKVEDLTQEAGFSCSLFAERSLAVADTTPTHYLAELRMRLAVQYTTHEGQTLETVAFSLGYQSLVAFSRAFKRVTGQPPGTLRATARQIQFLYRTIHVIADTEVPLLKHRVGDVKYQLGQLVSGSFAESKLLTAHVQSLLPLWWEAQQRLSAIAYHLRTDHFEHRPPKCNVAQRVRHVQFLSAQPRQPSGIIFSPLQHKWINRLVSVAIDGEGPSADDIALRTAALTIDNRWYR